ncbi:MAG: potassium channel family protein [Rubrobacteraceae bacterium]
MVAFLTVLVRFVRTTWQSLKDPKFQALLFVVFVMLTAGTLFYRNVEGWSMLDSLYFSVITLTTVGYGDLSPSTGASKVFTIFYVFVGVGIILGFVNVIAERSLKQPGIFSRLRHRREDEDEHEED